MSLLKRSAKRPKTNRRHGGGGGEMKFWVVEGTMHCEANVAAANDLSFVPGELKLLARRFVSGTTHHKVPMIRWQMRRSEGETRAGRCGGGYTPHICCA